VRFKSGEREVVEAMRTFAHYTVQAKEALLKRDYKTLAHLMNKNFDLRRKILGDRIIGSKNLKMIEIARTFGLSGKFAGSGGGVIGMYETEEQYRRLEAAYRENGFEFVGVSVDPGARVYGG
jgi:glucuronokinase